MQKTLPPLKAAASANQQQACVHLIKPFPDCYCMNLSSSNIRKMLTFCTGDFRSCPIYGQKLAEAAAAPGKSG